MPAHERRQQWEERLQYALASNDSALLAVILSDIHAADLADVFPDLEEDQQERVLQTLSDEAAAELLDELDPTDRSKMLDQLPVERTSDILDEMPSDEAADLLAELSAHEADELLQRMEPEQADDVADLLRYPEDTAGGLMAKEFVRLHPEQTIADAYAILRCHQHDAEMIYYQYVLDDEDRLLGIVTLRKLIVGNPTAEIADIMQRDYISVPVALPQDEVAETVRRYDLLAVPVLDDEGRMLGIITVDDIGDVVEEEAADDFMEMSGNVEETEVSHSWLLTRGWHSGLLALSGGVIALAIIWLLARGLAAWRETIFLLPVLLILGITIGSQAAIAMDRAYDNEVERRQVGRIFRREIVAGLILALIGGGVAGVLAYFLTGRTWTSVTGLALAMVAGLWCASLSGAIGASIVRRAGGWLGTTTHAMVVTLTLLLAITVYLLSSRWFISLSN